MEDKLSKLEQKKHALEKQIKAEKKKIADEKRKADAHQKIKLGGAVLSVLGREYREGDENRLIAFLRSQENRGEYFSRAMEDEKKENYFNAF